MKRVNLVVLVRVEASHFSQRNGINLSKITYFLSQV